jgi:hypothetical protein
MELISIERRVREHEDNVKRVTRPEARRLVGETVNEYRTVVKLLREVMKSARDAARGGTKTWFSWLADKKRAESLIHRYQAVIVHYHRIAR